MPANQVVVVFKSSTSWVVPEDCFSVQIECLSGTGYFSGLYGSSYSKTNSVSVTPGSILYATVGGAGGDTYVSKTGISVRPTSTTDGCLAVCYSSGVGPCCPGVTPINEIDGIGNVKYNGGYAGTPTVGLSSYLGGGGGSAGPNGRGGNGGDATGIAAGAGGGANGGTSANGTTPGTKRAGATGGDGGALGSKGTVEIIWTDFLGLSYGLSGGSGSGPAIGTLGPTGDPYGGGSGSGSQGLVILTYTRKKPSNATTVTRVFKTSTSSEQYLILPAGTTKVTIDAIGGGSVGNIVASGISTTNIHGGGGGSYANTVNTNVFSTGSWIAFRVAPTAAWNVVTTNTYATIGSSGEASLSSQNTYAVTAKTAYGRTSIKTSIGQRTANGGDGGLGFNGAASTTVRRGGGGGAA
ncbi:MAG: hypothetical protein EBU90_25155, partial [Proteobacteria bacterium]|nr:hypothetical protein [Pseudomonadota bacterium]